MSTVWAAKVWSLEHCKHWGASQPWHARTAHKGLLQKRLGEDLCWIVPYVSPMIQSSTDWTELNHWRMIFMGWFWILCFVDITLHLQLQHWIWWSALVLLVQLSVPEELELKADFLNIYWSMGGMQIVAGLPASLYWSMGGIQIVAGLPANLHWSMGGIQIVAGLPTNLYWSMGGIQIVAWLPTNL